MGRVKLVFLNLVLSFFQFGTLDSAPGPRPVNIQQVFEIWSMECSSKVSVAAFGPGDPGSNPGWFAVSNSNKKIQACGTLASTVTL